MHKFWPSSRRQNLTFCTKQKAKSPARAACSGATLARDVPFSAIYWSSLEPIRRALLPPDAGRASHAQIIWANFAAGTVGGGLAAAVTTPLDVVKTRTQVGSPGVPGSEEPAVAHRPFREDAATFLST
jgi:hypothetical protein